MQHRRSGSQSSQPSWIIVGYHPIFLTQTTSWLSLSCLWPSASMMAGGFSLWHSLVLTPSVHFGSRHMHISVCGCARRLAPDLCCNQQCNAWQGQGCTVSRGSIPYTRCFSLWPVCANGKPMQFPGFGCCDSTEGCRYPLTKMPMTGIRHIFSASF